MPLPILHGPVAPSQSDLIRLFHRTSLHLAEELAEGVQLDAGTAFCSSEFPLVHDANHLREAALPQGMSPAEAVAQVEVHFQSHGTRCAYWVMNPSAPAAKTEPLVRHLVEMGFAAKVKNVMHLQRPASLREAAGLKIIPARAAYKHARELAQERGMSLGEAGPQWSEAMMNQLDDPHWDALLALKDGRAVATAGVLAVGDLGRIEHVFVSEPYRRQGIGRTILGRAMEICARSLFKHVFLSVTPENDAAIRLYETCGFETIGQALTYARDASA